MASGSIQTEGVLTPRAVKRSDYLEWDEYFMALAFLSAQRSKDPSSQVGLNDDMILKIPDYRIL